LTVGESHIIRKAFKLMSEPGVRRFTGKRPYKEKEGSKAGVGKYAEAEASKEKDNNFPGATYLPSSERGGSIQGIF